MPPPAADRSGPPAPLVLLLPALIAGVLVWQATSGYGIGLSPDSMQFIAASKSLAAGHGLQRVEGTAFVEWAPLVPLRLAVTKDPIAFAPIMGIVSAAGIVWAGALWVFRRARSLRIASMAGVGLAISFPLIFVSAHLWSDGPFLFFALVGVLALGSAHQSDRRRAVALAAIPAALAALTRYLGVTLIAAGVVSLLLAPRQDRLQRAVLYGWLASLPLVAWLVRNVLVSGTATGEREPPGFSIAANALAFANAVAGDLLPWHWPGAIKLALCAGGLVAGWLLLRKSPRDHSAGPLGLFALFYGLAVVIVASIWGSDRIDVRLALPVFVALIAGAFAAGAQLRWRLVLAALALVWLGQSYIVTRRHVSLYAAQGVPGFGDAHWRASETLNLLRDSSPQGVVYSNAPEIAYVSLRREVRRSPRAHLFYARDAAVPDLEEFRGALRREGPATLVWFAEAGEDRFVAPSELGISLQQIAGAKDGALYRVSAR